ELRDRELASAGNLARRYDVSKSLDVMFADIAERMPGEIAIVDQGTRMTYAELDARSTDLAIYLKSRGIPDQSRIGLCVERSPEMIVGIIGILKASCAYVPLDPASPAERLKFIIEDSDIALLITQE
ncbi:AMP-binding protein, partial [Acinetobacter baumannii]|uniref:AMP-binding protein n=1 Tax=Acinetobacter baumannii TaxID=470 RepID=UPI000A5ECC3A